MESELEEMRGRGSRPELRWGPEPRIHLFERSKESGERILKRFWPLARLAEIAMPELIGGRDYSRPHRPVFVRPLRPRNAVFAVDPKPESHVSVIYYDVGL